MRVTAPCLYSVLMRGPLCVVPLPSEPDAAVVPLVVAFHFVAILHTSSHADTVFFCLGYKALLVDDWPDCLDAGCFHCACEAARRLGNLHPAVLLSWSHSSLENKVHRPAGFSTKASSCIQRWKIILFVFIFHAELWVQYGYWCSAQSNNMPLNFNRRVFTLNCDD